MKKKLIRITCETRDTLPFPTLEVFQGTLKKRTPEDIRKIRESIEKHGFATPFFVWKDKEHNWLLDGTGRYETLELMRQKGWEFPSLPVVYIKARNDADARELLLKITSQYGKVSAKGLEEFLKGLEIDFDSLGLNVFIKQDLPVELGIVPAVPLQTVTQTGDVYEFCDTNGEVRHKLICADAGSEDDFKLLMENEKAALVFTDPPYGLNIGEKERDMKHGGYKPNAAREAEGISGDLAGDNTTPQELRAMLMRVFKNMYRYMRDDASFYICGGSYPDLIQAQITAMGGAGLLPHHLLIWVKNQATFTMGRADYDYQHELIWYGWKKSHHFYGQGKYKTTVWNFKKPQKSDLHPTMKPPELIEEAIKNSMEPIERCVNGVVNNTGKNAVVLDPFAGSGSTLAACEKLKRRAYLIEISAQYCDIIVKRALGINPTLVVYQTRKGSRKNVTPLFQGEAQ